jgi:hypothetical protein
MRWGGDVWRSLRWLFVLVSLPGQRRRIIAQCHAPKIVSGIVGGLFLEDADLQLEALMNFDQAHFRAHPPVRETSHAASS